MIEDQITAQHSPVNEEVLHVHNLAYELARSVGSKDILVISDATTKKEAKQSSCNHDYRYAQLSTPVLLSVDPKNCINKARSLILKTLESERFVNQVISENKYLRVLDLSGCSICELPDCIFKLKHLRYLDASGLPITILPPELGNLVKLEMLDVSGTNLTLVPSCISSLRVLKYLNLKGCQNLQQLQSLDELHELCYLNLSGCLSVRNLPESLQELKNLCFLNLADVHILHEGLLQSLERLKSLEDLILSGFKLQTLPDIFGQLSSLRFLNLSRCSTLQQLPQSFFELQSLKGLRILDLSNCSQMEIVIGTPTNLEVLVLVNVALPLDLNFLTQLQNLQKLDITDATLSTAALSNLKHILSCMPMLKSVETNSLDVYSILPSRISRVMNFLTGVESSNVRDRENTDGRQTTSVVEAGGPNASAEGSDLVGHSSSSSEEKTEDTSVENANRDLTSSTNSDATKVDALEDYANPNINGEPKLQDSEHHARSIKYCSSSSFSSGALPSASSSGTSTLDSNFKTEGPVTHCKEDEISVLG
ncbi:disease resistance protein RPV1-like [Miscanthus floridulus]|uniref:disease resistance protein RPV1-like n=1 Tax=Miscanthus floridulus TaxID=154761 RepID=UPI00345889FB